MEELIEILKKFEEERKKSINEHTWDEEAVAKCFKDNCAKDILCNGYFLVNNKYIIDLGAIELYYHEEGEGKDKIKDYAMYHIPERYQSPKSELINIFNGIKNENDLKDKKMKLPYFKLGSFNLHQSGVDVTFEKENEYRASFLIRAYRVLEAVDEGKYPTNSTTPYDIHSTHIFDDMFYDGFNNQIKWIKYEKGGDIDTDIRKNLKIRKLATNKKGKDFIDTISEFDKRKWQFKIKGLEVNNAK